MKTNTARKELRIEFDDLYATYAVPALCRLCGAESESFLHFITMCSSLAQERTRILQKSFVTPCKWEVEEVMEFSRLPAISEFMDRYGFYSEEREDNP